MYTREAHPGERYPAHASIDDKMRNARDMVDRFGIRRPTLVDDLDGTVHRAYGLLPNMTYVVAPGGRIVYKADWTDARTLELALDHLVYESGERRRGARLAPFRVDWAPHRVNERPAFMEGLLIAGVRAVDEFIAAVKENGGEAAARPLESWWSEHPRNPAGR